MSTIVIIVQRTQRTQKRGKSICGIKIKIDMFKLFMTGLNIRVFEVGDTDEQNITFTYSEILEKVIYIIVFL